MTEINRNAWLGLRDWLSSRSPDRGDDAQKEAKRLLDKERRKTLLRIEKEEPVQLQMVDFERGLGVILPIFSIPSPHGMGTFGKKAYEFLDFLHKSGIRYWQILPLNPTGYGDSPYSGTSSWAGNPYFIDLDILVEEGLLSKEEIEEAINSARVDLVREAEEEAEKKLADQAGKQIVGDERETEKEQADGGDQDAEKVEKVNYALIEKYRLKILKKAYSRRPESQFEERRSFEKENAYWLKDFALYFTIKLKEDLKPWYEWPEDLKKREPEALEEIKEEEKETIDFIYWLQYKFYQQWEKLKDYAVKSGIYIIGDIPIYVAMDSADVWSNPAGFLLDENLNAMALSGAPPDFYNEDGQLWGNPIYDWEAQKKDDYSFWVARMAHSLRLYNVIRLDHFIGFERYWSVEPHEDTAKNGEFIKGPGIDFFHVMEDKLGPLPILVEDLGVMDEDVLYLRRQTGFPGMRPIVFAFGGDDSDYLPHNYVPRTSVYTSTHDSDTLKGWWDKVASDKEKARMIEYFGLDEQEGLLWGILRGVCSSVADFCIFPMQDLLMLGNEARINRPGTVGGNWDWRLSDNYISQELEIRIREMAELYGRI